MNWLKLIDHIHQLNRRVTNLEGNTLEISESIHEKISILREHLIRVKNGQILKDRMISLGCPYLDLSPFEALEYYNNPDSDYTIIDLADTKFQRETKFDHVLMIPFHELKDRIEEIKDISHPLLLICENGLNSILACQYLSEQGFYNCFNISGGYRHWPTRNDKLDDLLNDDLESA